MQNRRWTCQNVANTIQNGRWTCPHVGNPMQNGRWTCQNVANTIQNGRWTCPHVVNPMQNGRWTCPNVANTMQSDKFKFQTVANTRQMAPAKKSKKNPKPAQKKNPKTISHPQKNDPRRSHNIFKGSQWTLKLRKRSGLCNTPGPWNHPSWSASKIANLRTCLRFLGRSHGSMVYLNQIPWDHGLRPSKIHDGPMVYLNQHHVFFSQEKHVFFANPMVLNVHWPIGWGFDEFDQPTWPDYFQSSSVFFGARAWGVITKIASGLCTKKMGPGERERYIYIL